MESLKTNQAEISKIRIEDLTVFLERFRQNEGYLEALGVFFQGKTLADDVSEDEKIAVFERSEQAKKALIDFAEENPVAIDIDSCPPQAVGALKAYLDFVSNIKLAGNQNLSPDVIQALDQQRSILHNEAAERMLFSGLVPNFAIGLVVSRLILIGRGLDSHESARETIIERLKRGLS